jgi:hypothetical protein
MKAQAYTTRATVRVARSAVRRDPAEELPDGE